MISALVNKHKNLILFVSSVLFASSFGTRFIFDSNQHTYLLHGISDSGFGDLEKDWLVNTIDPFPFFSLIVNYLSFNSLIIQCFNILLLIVFIYSIYLILSHSTDLLISLKLKIVSISIISLILSPAPYRILGFSFYSGVAGQYIPSNIIQPSGFGVLIFCSIAFFLKKQYFKSILFLSLSYYFHSSYLLVAALFTLSFILILVKERDFLCALKLGFGSALFSLPVVIFIFINFSPTSPEIIELANDIIVNYRIPHHAKVDIWASNYTKLIFNLSLIIFSLFLYRKSRIFIVILIPLIVSVFLTILQYFIESNQFALLFPWRVSTVLNPLCTSLLIFKFILFFEDKFKFWNTLLVTSIAFQICLSLVGIHRSHVTYINFKGSSEFKIEKYIYENIHSSGIFLTPLKMESFRLYTGKPIFVDHKSHPYKDVEVVEWKRRIDSQRKFYDSMKNGGTDYVDSFLIKNKINFILTDNDAKLINTKTTNFELIKEIDNYKLFVVSIL